MGCHRCLIGHVLISLQNVCWHLKGWMFRTIFFTMLFVLFPVWCPLDAFHCNSHDPKTVCWLVWLFTMLVEKVVALQLQRTLQEANYLGFIQAWVKWHWLYSWMRSGEIKMGVVHPSFFSWPLSGFQYYRPWYLSGLTLELAVSSMELCVFSFFLWELIGWKRSSWRPLRTQYSLFSCLTSTWNYWVKSSTGWGQLTV